MRASIFSSFYYIFIMIIAASFSLIRGFISAKILNLSDFGLYSTVISVGIFSSVIVSFGETEKTIKTFPRLWLIHQNKLVVFRVAQSSKRILIRSCLATLSILCIYFFLDEMKFFAFIGLLVIPYATCVVISNLYASAIRATGEVNLLANNNFFRALLVIMLGTAGTVKYGWQGAIFGEILGTSIGIFFTKKTLISLSNSIKESSNIETFDSNALVGGRWLFFSSLFMMCPAFLDRAFISSIYGHDQAGTYGFLMLFTIGANTFSGIIAQKVGPRLIKMEHSGSSVFAQVRYVIRWFAFIWITIGFGLLVSNLIMTKIEPGQYFYNKFHLSPDLMFATSILCAFQTNVLMDFIILSKNEEKSVFLSSLFYFLTTLIVVYIVIVTKPPLPNVFLMVACAKAMHFLMQCFYILKLWIREKY